MRHPRSPVWDLQRHRTMSPTHARHQPAAQVGLHAESHRARGVLSTHTGQSHWSCHLTKVYDYKAYVAALSSSCRLDISIRKHSNQFVMHALIFKPIKLVWPEDRVIMP